MAIKRPEILDEVTRQLLQTLAYSEPQEQAAQVNFRNHRSSAKLAKLGEREQRARAYSIMADRLSFHLAAATLPSEVAEHVQLARDALTRASAALKR
jgi:hypothetical protein